MHKIFCSDSRIIRRSSLLRCHIRASFYTYSQIGSDLKSQILFQKVIYFSKDFYCHRAAPAQSKAPLFNFRLLPSLRINAASFIGLQFRSWANEFDFLVNFPHSFGKHPKRKFFKVRLQHTIAVFSACILITALGARLLSSQSRWCPALYRFSPGRFHTIRKGLLRFMFPHCSHVLTTIVAILIAISRAPFSLFQQNNYICYNYFLALTSFLFH